MQQDCSLGGKEKRCSPFLCHLATGAGLILGALKLNLCVKAVAEKFYPDPMFAELMPFSALIILFFFFFPLRLQPFTFR